MNVAVVGAQWGDEGKGKIVDLLAPSFSIVARSAGGHNAGHTVHVGGQRFVLRLIPSGILHPAVTCYIGNGVVVDLQAFFEEVDELSAAGIDVDGRLFVSDRAHIILPHHRDLDTLGEARRGARRIGTTSRGIGPAYEDKVSRRGIRMCDLVHEARVREHVEEVVEARNRLDPGHPLEWRAIAETTLALGARMAPWITDVSVALAAAMAAKRRILFEGAQGTMLDLDHGTYPYVTSSSATAGGVCTGLGVAPRAIGGVLGITKAYTTRVGEGPFPTELHDVDGEGLRARGSEFGAVTGRPRRCGWFDTVVVRHSARVNGLDALAVTKLDVLDGLSRIPVCVAYRCGGTTVTEFPADLDRLAQCEPVLEDLPGWARPTAGVRRLEDLPPEARAYLARLEALTGVPALLVSTGAAREDTIVADPEMARRWFGWEQF